MLNCVATPLQEAHKCSLAPQQALKGMIREFILTKQHMDNVFWNETLDLEHVSILCTLRPYTLLLQFYYFTCVKLLHAAGEYEQPATN